ncbi:hypothetical protein RYX36_006782 [Vicia faba]
MLNPFLGFASENHDHKEGPEEDDLKARSSKIVKERDDGFSSKSTMPIMYEVFGYDGHSGQKNGEDVSVENTVIHEKIQVGSRFVQLEDEELGTKDVVPATNNMLRGNG